MEKGLQARASPCTILVMRALTYSFWTFVSGWALLFPFASPELEARFGAVSLVGIALLLIGGWAYVMFLGVAAHKAGKSWIVWVGLTLITSPLGFLVSYAMAIRKLTSHS
jgi:hypothetical protein